MLEWIAIGVVIFFIAILFYKQANLEIEILQVDGERLIGKDIDNPLPTLYTDRSPIVVKDYPLPSLGTMKELAKRKTLMSMQVAPSLTLQQFLNTEATSILTPITASFLAKESGLSIWFQQTLQPLLFPNPYTRIFYFSKQYLWPKRKGLFRTTAFQTLLFPTETTMIVSIMLPKVEPYLPTGWRGKAFKEITINDTPLLNQITFVDIKLRKGNLLLLPPHLIVDVYPENKKEIGFVFHAELHHPISYLASLSQA